MGPLRTFHLFLTWTLISNVNGQGFNVLNDVGSYDYSEDESISECVNDLVCAVESGVVVELPENSVDIQHNNYLFIEKLDTYVAADSYCKKYATDDAGNLVPFFQICLAAPDLPVCCSENQTAIVQYAFNSSSKIPASVVCLNNSDSKDNINTGIHVNDKFVTWNNLYFSDAKVFCPKNYELVVAEITADDTSRSYLSYDVLGVQLNWLNPSGQHVTLNPYAFCLDGNGSENTTGFFCYQDPQEAHELMCSGSTCVRKCCGKNEIFLENVGCEEYDQLDTKNWKPAIYNETSGIFIDNTTSMPYFREIYGMPLCQNYVMMNQTKTIGLLSTGDLKDLHHDKLYSAKEYCLENSLIGDDSSLSIVFLCSDDTGKTSCEKGKLLQLILPLISCILVLLFLIDNLIQQRLSNQNARCQISFGFTLLVSIICSIILQQKNINPGLSCDTFRVLYYYFTLAIYTWLVVLCNNATRLAKVSQSSDTRLFLMSFALGWGVPLLFSLVAAGMDSLAYYSEENTSLQRMRSNILFLECIFPKKDIVSLWIYTYSPMVILLVLSFILLLNAFITKPKIKSPTSNNKSLIARCFSLVVLFTLLLVVDMLTHIFEETCYIMMVTDLLRGSSVLFILTRKPFIFMKLHTLCHKKGSMDPSLSYSENPKPAPLLSIFGTARSLNHPSVVVRDVCPELQEMRTFRESDMEEIPLN